MTGFRTIISSSLLKQIVGQMMRYLWMVVLCSIGLPVWGALQLRLDTNDAPPYQISRDGDVSGLAVDVLHCVMQQMKLGYEIHVVPWRRAQADVQHGLSDGLFSVMRWPEMDRYATLSSPLVLEKWYWYARNPALLERKDFPAGLRIGVLRGSNQDGWLMLSGKPPAQIVNRLDSLLKLLQIGRIDIILADQQAMQHQLPAGGDALSMRFDRYMPLGVYFSSRLIASRPDFLSAFNARLANCHGQDYLLSASEAQTVREVVGADFRHWQQHPLIAQLLQSPPAADPALQAHDRFWQQAAVDHQPYPAWMLEVLQSPLSRALADWQSRQHGLYPEVFISLAGSGQLLATASLTTDYWQGDEEKVTQTIKQARLAGPSVETHWIDRCPRLAQEMPTGCIDYDDSSQKFIAHISFPLWSGDEVVAVMTFGVDVEAVLQQGELPPR